MPETETGVFRWEAYEHEHIERESDWFWALGIIAACGALTSLIFGNVLFALVILLAAVSFALVARHKPELHEFEINDRGIRVSGDLHTYESIISFWVETENGREPTLLVDTTAFMSPNLFIPLDGVNPDELRRFLGKHCKEKKMHEPLSHKIIEAFGL